VRRKWICLLTGTLITSFCAILFLRSSLAQGGNPVARSQFRTTDSSGTDFNPIGKLIMTEEGGQQIFRVQLEHLEITDLSIYVSTNSFYDGTNSPVFVVAPLHRINVNNGSWSQTLTGTGGAPPEFQALGVANLSDLSGIRSIDIGNPGVTNIIGGSNFVNCVQTVVSNTTIITCTTNIIGGVTNILINAFAWAPIPPIVINPNISSFHRSFAMQRPTNPPDSHAAGKIQLSYNGTTGRSLLDINLNGLLPGQNYTLWLSDGGSNFSANVFPLNSGGSKGLVRKARLRLDTSLGDSLPIQVSSTADLTGRVFTVRDGTSFIYLTGSLP
jgi:hypothetical protein